GTAAGAESLWVGSGARADGLERRLRGVLGASLTSTPGSSARPTTPARLVSFAYSAACSAVTAASAGGGEGAALAAALGAALGAGLGGAALGAALGPAAFGAALALGAPVGPLPAAATWLGCALALAGAAASPGASATAVETASGSRAMSSLPPRSEYSLRLASSS